MTRTLQAEIRFLLAWFGCFLASCTTLPPHSLSSELISIVNREVTSLIASDFPELCGISIEYGLVSESTDTVFFETYVKPATAFRAPKNRTYQLLLNKRLETQSPSNDAIRSILVHELLHIRDYVGMNLWELLKLRRDIKDAAFQQQYERYTDLRTLQLGYGLGLIDYREWLYTVISDEQQIAAKQKTYMTPEEIKAWLAMQSTREAVIIELANKNFQPY